MTTLRETVRELLGNGIENGYREEMMLDPAVVLADIRACTGELEDEADDVVLPLIAAWQAEQVQP